jgi:hypothetical protein
MATDVPSTVPSDQAAAAGPEARQVVDHITVYSHSNLMYWWPVWLVCFVAAAITYMGGHQMAVVPDGTVAVAGATVVHPDHKFPGQRDVMVAPEGRHFPLIPTEAEARTDRPDDDPTAAGKRQPVSPSMSISSSNSLGVIFAMTLVVVAIVSTLLLRGLVSLIVIILMVTAVITLAFLDMWDDIFLFFGGLDIRMNAAGYLFIGVPLFLVWAFVFFVQDRMHFMTFDEGQIRYVLEVGDSAMVMPAEGVMVEKKRSDVFRHWILGFGTGDLVLRARTGQEIELPNITNANRKMAMINDMLRHKPIVIETT